MPAPAPLTLRDIDGQAILVAHDGTFLGRLSSNAFDSESVCNEFGSHGSEFSSTSVRNEFSPYGSEFSSDSAYNEFTSTPPRIVYRDSAIGYLTKNRFLAGGVDPDALFAAYRCARRR